MRVTTTDGHELLFVQEKPGMVLVYGSETALECFTNGVTLAGTEVVDGPENDSERSTGLIPHPVATMPPEAPSEAVEGMSLKATPGTVALWLDFEAQNFL